MKILNATSHFAQHPLLIPNRYKVMITAPVDVGGAEMTINCVGCSIPNRSMATVERFIIGPVTKIPYQEIFDDLTLVFRLASDMKERGMIDKWMELIGGKDYGVAYFTNVKGDITIQVLNQEGKTTQTYKFEDVIPTGLSETSFRYDSADISEITMTFGFHKYEHN